MAKFTKFTLSSFLSLCKEVTDRIDTIKKSVETLAALELARSNGTSYILSLDNSTDQLRRRIAEIEAQEKQGSIYESGLFDEVIQVRDRFNGELNDFEKSIGSEPNNAEAKSKVSSSCNRTSSLINETTSFFLAILERAEYLIRVDNLVQEAATIKDGIQTLQNDRKEFIEKYQSLLDTSKVKIDALDQITRNKEIEDIANYYKDYKELTQSSYNFMLSIFYSLLGFGTLALLFLFLDVSWLHMYFKLENMSIEISKNWFLFISFSGLIGLYTFLLTDLRKRVNIGKSIIDEITQKEAILKAYVVLLTKIKDQNSDNQSELEHRLFSTIIQNLLEVKNHGFSGKEMQSISTNVFMEIIGKLAPKRD